MDASSAKDFRKIWTGARSLGIDKETVHGLAEQIAKRSIFSKAKGAPSLTVLTKSERWQLIQDLQAKGAFSYRGRRDRPSGKGGSSPKSSGRKSGKGSALDIISPAQQGLIETLFVQLAAIAPDFGKPEYRRGFIFQVLGKNWPQKKWEAGKAIEALKRRLRQG